MSVSPSLRLVLTSLASLAVSFAVQERSARAQEPMPPLPPPAEAPPAPAPVVQAPAPVIVLAPEPPVDVPAKIATGENPADVRFVDAHADRVILGSTAETHPAGTFFFSDYEIALLQVGYAFTDDLQISFSTVPPIARNQPYFLDLGLKLNVVRTDVFRAAVGGSLEVFTSSGSNAGTYTAGRLTAIGQLCFTETCRSSLSFNVGTVVSGAYNNSAVPVYGSAGLIANVSPLVSLLAEPVVVGAANDGSNGAALFAFDYGVRLAQKNFGVDLTFVAPVAVTSGNFDNPLILGYPFVAFTYRTDGFARAAGAQTAQGGHVANDVALLTGRPSGTPD